MDATLTPRKQRQHETAMTDAKRKIHLAIQAAAPGPPAGWRVTGGERQAGEDVPDELDAARNRSSWQHF